VDSRTNNNNIRFLDYGMEERILVVATTEKEEKGFVLVLDEKVFLLTVDAV